MNTYPISRLAAAFTLALVLVVPVRATVFSGISDRATLDTRSGLLTLNPADLPKALADNATTTSTLAASGLVGSIGDVNVTLDLSHPASGELAVWLVSPQGTRVRLLQAVGGSGTNFTDTVLDDEASTPIASGIAPFTASFRPADPLSALDGQNPNGTWTLEIRDAAAGNTGTLNRWSLDFDLTTLPIVTTVFTWANAITGNWSDSTKWTDDQAGGTAPGTVGQADYTLNFNAAGTYTATNNLTAGFLLNRLNFGGSSVTVAGSRLQFVANGATAPQLNQNADSEVTVSAPISLGATLTLGGTGTGAVTLANVVSGTGGLTKTNPGTLTLPSLEAYTGTTTVDAGTLLANGSLAAGSSVIVAAAGTLGGDGTVAGTISVAGTLAPGSTAASTGTLTTGTATLTGTYACQLDGTTCDQLAVSGDLDLTGSTLAVAVLAGGPTQSSYGIATYTGTRTGFFDTVTGLPADYTVDYGTPNQVKLAKVVPLAPLVTTGTASAITLTVATLSGTVNPNGFATTAQFDYGLTTAYGSTAAVSLSPNNGTSAQNVSTNLTGLSTGTTYHYRLTATNANGSVQSTDMTFATVGSSAKDILTFVFPGLPATTISGTNISVTVPYGTNVTALAPTYTASPLATGSPASSTARNFTIPQTYTITAQDLSTKVYIVTVSQPAAITTHPAATTTINSGTTITLTVTAGGTAPFTYQWYQGVSGSTTTPVGNNSASFTTPALTSTTSYWVRVSNVANPIGADSNTATITVRTMPTLFWDGNVASANSNSNNSASIAMDWLSGGNWDSGATSVPRSSWTAGTAAVFGGTTAGQTVTLASPITVGGLTFQTPGYTLVGSSINLNGSSTPLIANQNASLASTLAGAGGLLKSGAGTVSLDASNTFTGGTVISGGTLLLTNARAIPNSSTNTITVNNGGRLSFGRQDVFGYHSDSILTPILINAGGTVTNNGTFFNSLNTVSLNGGTLTAIAGNSAAWPSYGLKGNVTALTGVTSTMSAAGANAGYQLGDGTILGTTFDVQGTGILNVSGDLQDGRNSSSGLQASFLTKTGAGTMILTAANSYTGITTISDGVLSVGTIGNAGVAGNLGTATSASSNLVLNGGSLQFTGASHTTNRGMTLNNVADNGIEIAQSNTTLTLSGILTGAGGFTKSGPGTLILGGNSYTGATVVAGGTLRLTRSLVASSGVVTVNSGAALGGTGAIPRPVTAASGAILTPGSPTLGTLTVNSLALQGAATINMVPSSTRLNITTTNGLNPADGANSVTLNLGTNALPRNALPARIHNLIAYSGAIQGAGFSAFKLGTVPAGVTCELKDNPGSVDVEIRWLTEGDFQYTVADGAAILTGYMGGGDALVIPDMIGGLPVIGIGAYALLGNTVLTSVTIPVGVTSIEDFAFANCSGLTSVTISAAVTSIGDLAFSGCSGLTAINVDAANVNYSSRDGVLFNKTLSVLIQFPGGKSGAYTIPFGVTSIGDYAFDGCSGVTSVTIPTSVTSIGVRAFEDCSGLTNMTIPSSVTSIGYGTFLDCTGLTSVTIPASVTSIGSYAFDGCSGLTSMTIPSGVTSIEHGAFMDCTALTDTLFMGNAPTMGTGVFYGTGAEFTVYYLEGATGFTSPLWLGYPAVNLGAAAAEIAVEQPSGTALVSGVGTVDYGMLLVPAGMAKTYILKNAGALPLTGVSATLSGPDAADFVLGTALPATLPAIERTTLVLTFAPGSGGVKSATLSIASNDADEDPFVIHLSGTATAVPAITSQPMAAQTVAANTTVTLTAAASGFPAPTFQWYQGASGDTLSPVAGATAASFITPALNASTGYWVRASNERGHADSATALITVSIPPSANPNLLALEPGFGALSPAFDPAVITYQVNLPNEVVELTLTPTVAEAGATVTLNGTPVPSGTPGEALELAVGDTVASLRVAAADGITTKTYTVTFTRAAPVVVRTDPAEVRDATTATLKGTVIPHGLVTVHFEYGLTTAYGGRTADEAYSGAVAVEFAAPLPGLAGATTYHYRAVAVGVTGPVYGDDVAFATAAEPPLVASGEPTTLTDSGATLAGAVDPRGQLATVHFEYGLSSAYGRSTLAQALAAGAGLVEVADSISDLIAGATYHCRIVASNAAGTSTGEDVVFVVRTGGPGPVIITAPAAATGGAAAIATDSAILLGSATPNGGATVVHFEFGPTTGYGRRTTEQSVGNGRTAVDLSLATDGLLPGTVYHYRLVATNSVGTTAGADRSFTTRYPAPAAVTGGAEILTSTRARLSATVKANGAATEVWFDYGSDGFTFPFSVRATPGSVGGNASTGVSAEPGGLAQGVTYSYRVRATSAGGTSLGATESFAVAMLSGLIQEFPAAVPLAARQGSLTVKLSPSGIASGWRLAGEQSWRSAGSAASGLVSGDRVIEYRPVPGMIQPASEAVTVVSGAPAVILDRSYNPSGETASGSLSVTLKPQHLADAVPEGTRLQWRLAGDSAAPWIDSGETLRGIAPGNHLIECKEVPGRTTPESVTAVIVNRHETKVTITYQLTPSPVGTPPDRLDYAAVADGDRPYAYVGQIRSAAGAGSGFVVRPGVVATAGHVVFDDGTLSAVSGLEWLFQRDRVEHEPLPQLPRGYYLMSGYAARRALENTPGSSAPESQALDAAALYFLSDAGRGGYSGYLASDSPSNEFLVSPALKTLAGFPVNGVPAADRDRMHATPPANVTFAPAFGGTYTTADIRSFGGSSGGPLCVQYETGNYYPAAIYLGGSNQAVVRAIDSTVADLIGFAETSATTGVTGTGGSLTQTGASPVASEAGVLQVFIEPEAARAAGAGWRLRAGAPYQAGGSREEDLDPNTYTVEFATVAGFVPPGRPTVTLRGGELSTITFSYEKIILPPVITSAAATAGPRDQALSYQISALNEPDSYQLRGLLPDGMSFDASRGLVSGTPTLAGNFVVTVGATNRSGSVTRTVAVSALPLLADQSLSAPFNRPLAYQLASSEIGAGLTYTADGLPRGLALDPVSGVIAGTPLESGSFTVPVSVTVRSATGSATLTLQITGTEPLITSQAVAARSVSHGAVTTLSVTADGLPVPTFQWYQGEGGDTSAPLPGATAATLTTPPLTITTRFWVRVSSISGSADSDTTIITVLSSTNPNLAKLVPSAGSLSPAFNADIAHYTLAVPNAVESLTLTPSAEVGETTVRIDGTPCPLNQPCAPISLAVGDTTVSLTATAGDGATVKTHTLTVTRGAPALAVTGPASAVTDKTATLEGTLTPNGPVTAFFEYGPTDAYGDATPPQEFSGEAALAVEAALTGLSGDRVHHYRLVVISAGGTVAGDDRSFTTSLDQALAATGDASDVDTISALLVGAVATNGLATDVHFEIGTTSAYGTSTPVQKVPGGGGVVDVFFTATGLTPDTVYLYRVVAENTLGTVYGEEVRFQAVVGGGGSGSGTPSSAPGAATGAATDLTTTAALLRGAVNPHYGTTLIRFEYGLTTAYGSVSASRGVGNANEPVNVALPVSGLQPGRSYHYRLVAENSDGASTGADATFTTGSLPPEVTTGAAQAFGGGSVLVSGVVRARGSSAAVWFDLGTDGTTFPTSVQASPASASGELEIPVSALFANLDERTTYYYRVRAVGPGGEVPGSVIPLKLADLRGLEQSFGRELGSAEHQGRLVVSLIPAGTGGWRFIGETAWRPGDLAVSGLGTGERDIEFRPLAGHIQPQRETVSIISGEASVVIERFYFRSAATGSAGIRVNLAPADLAAVSVAEDKRAQWRLQGDADATWRDSGALTDGLMPGSYLVECKPVPGWENPTAATLVVAAGETRAISLSYLAAAGPMFNPPKPVPFNKIANSRNIPYAHLGQVRGAAGTYSGFVVKSRVVATAAQAVFDEATLSIAENLQWLLQRDNGAYEPDPQVPRGCYVFDGYAAQRAAEASPGTLAIESLNFNAAALYFSGDADRGGYSGYLASDRANNQFLRSNSSKTLIGYPVKGVAPANEGRMHATAPLVTAFSLAYDRTYTSAFIRGYGGMAGGPLCVQYQGGAYLPAGIYVGGTSLGTVRAIDGKMVDLFTRAEISGNGGDNHTGGGITHSSFSLVGAATQPGALKVTIEPAAARAAGAGWRLEPETSYRESDARKAGLNAGAYLLQLRPVAGYQTPAEPVVTIRGGEVQELTFTYLENAPPPVIASAASATGTRGFPLVYQIESTGRADSYDLTGSLPQGLVLNSATGFISGTLQQAGIFQVTVTATNSGGSGSLPLTLTARPALADQRASVPFGQALTYQIASSESGPGVAYAAVNLPPGVVLNPATGLLSGVPLALGEFIHSISVTKGGATNIALFTLTVTPTALQSWRLAHFGTTDNEGDAADSADPDGDTKINLDEFAAGTDPNNAADFFRVLTSARTAAGFTVTAAGKAGRGYVLERGAALGGGPWTEVDATAILAADGPVSLSDPESPPGSGFYRMKVTAP